MSIDLDIFKSFVRVKTSNFRMTDVVNAPTHKGFGGTSDPELAKKLLERHPDLKVKEVPGGGNAYYMGKDMRDAAGRAGDSFIGMPAEGATKDMGVQKAFGGGTPEVLAHELGHREFGKTTAGKVFQNPYAYGIGTNPVLGMAAGGLAGYAEGTRKAKQKARGEKSTKIPYGALAPLALAAPMLISEGMASRNAMKMLRESGASGAQLSKARGTLGKAFATYLSRPAMGLGAYAGGRALAAHQAKANQE